MDFKEIGKYIWEKRLEIFKIAIYIFLTIYTYNVHEYLGEYKTSFQWIMFIMWCIFTIVGVLSTTVKELSIFGNKVIMKDYAERLADIENNTIIQNQALARNSSQTIEQAQVNNPEYNISYIYSYKASFELYLAIIYMMLKKKQKMHSQTHINFIEIIGKIKELNLVDNTIYNTLFRIEVLLNKKEEDIEPNDYHYLESESKRIFKELENVQRKINDLQ